MRVALVDGDEFGAETEADDCDIWFGCGHDWEGDRFSVLPWRGENCWYVVALRQGDNHNNGRQTGDKQATQLAIVGIASHAVGGGPIGVGCEH